MFPPPGPAFVPAGTRLRPLHPGQGRHLLASGVPSAVPVPSLHGAVLARRLSRELGGSAAERSGAGLRSRGQQRSASPTLQCLPPTLLPFFPPSRPVRPSVRCPVEGPLSPARSRCAALLGCAVHRRMGRDGKTKSPSIQAFGESVSGVHGLDGHRGISHPNDSVIACQ